MKNKTEIYQEYASLLDIVGVLYDLDCEELLNTLNVVANLLYEVRPEARLSAAKYQRTFKHGKLSIKLEFNND